MIVDDFDSVGTNLGPDKTDPPLLIHTNAVFSRSVALQGFKSIARRRTQSGQRRSRVEHVQLASDCLGNGAPLSRADPVPEETFGFGVREADNHPVLYTIRIA
jgi:hypothetical protein